MVPSSALENLKRNFRGQVLRPEDPGYDQARKIWNGMIDKHPDLIATCHGAGDVVNTVKFAREHDLTIAVRGGGHNIAGKCVPHGGLLIDLSGMKGVRVDLARQTARAQSGVKLGEFDRETHTFGLATTLGIATDTGIAGITLGGGYGWLAGKFGMACDNLISADVVTAEGELLAASESTNPDLFWGVRVGGGNFGVVTSFEYQLHPVNRIYGGVMFYPFSAVRQAMPVFHELSRTAPDELSTFVVPAAALGGTPATGIAVCYCGDPSCGEQVVAPLRKLGTPLADLIQERSYVEMQSLFDDLFTPGRMYYWKSSLMRKVDDGFTDVVLEHAKTMPMTAGSFIYMQQLHGAATRVRPSDTAFPHRYDHYNCGPLAGWDSPAETEKNLRWARQCWDALQPFYERSAYVNDLGEEGEQRVREAFGENYSRLVALKKKIRSHEFLPHEPERRTGRVTCRKRGIDHPRERTWGSTNRWHDTGPGAGAGAGEVQDTQSLAKHPYSTH